MQFSAYYGKTALRTLLCLRMFSTISEKKEKSNFILSFKKKASDMQQFEFSASSIDDITDDIDDDIINAILNENALGHGLDQALHKFNNTFLDTLKDYNEQDFSCNSTKKIESSLFDTKEENFASNSTRSLEIIHKSFDPFTIESPQMKGGLTLTKEQQMEKINQYSKTLKPTFLEMKRSSKKKDKKENASTFPSSLKYRDLSMLTDEQVELKFKSMVGRSQESFPVKLHKVIDEIEQDGLSSIISWSPHGRAFRIYDNTLFVKEVMSRYFYQTKMSSFTRQLGKRC